MTRSKEVKSGGRVWSCKDTGAEWFGTELQSQPDRDTYTCKGASTARAGNVAITASIVVAFHSVVSIPRSAAVARREIYNL